MQKRSGGNTGPVTNVAASGVITIFLVLGVGFAQTQLHAQEWRPRAQAALSALRGSVKLPGLHRTVRVVRDRWGVAHIFAANQHDLFFAQGYVAAQDRLFQMELWKRSGQGRLAEVMGAAELQHDIRARLLRYRGDMEVEYRSYSPDTKEILEAFTAGVNAYIRERTTSGGSGLPGEFQAAGFSPELWKPEDCLNRMAAFSMTGNAFSELAHAQAISALGVEKATEMAAFDPPTKLDPAPGIDYSGLSPELLKDLVGSDRRMVFSANVREGSNNWTVSGKLTGSGKPLLANDPHRIIAEPSLRYIVHLVAPGWNVIGAGEPALPGVAAGHNERIAWGFTIFGLDQQDLYFEQKNPANPNEYRTDQGWQPFHIEQDTVAVRGSAPVPVQLKFTRHGPVLWEDQHRALVLRWVGAEPGTAGYLGSLAVDRAQNWKEFTESMARWKVPSENIVYADVDGNIGEFSTGLAPLRKNWTGLLPVPGTGGYEWSGFVPTQDLPHTYNPAAQFIATANHKMIPDGYPYKVGYEWATPERFLRISEVLRQAQTAHHALTVEDMEALQSDVFSAPACELQSVLKKTPENAGGPYRKMILDWDCRVTATSGAAALYEIWAGDLQSAILERRVPVDLRKLVRGLGATHEVEGFLRTSSDSDRNALLVATLNAAGEKLNALEGSDPSKWSWGQLHVLRLRHGLDALLPASLVDPPVVQRPGDGNTVNATAYSAGSDSYQQLAGASYREIIDLSDWDKSVAINTPGQSGEPGSKHYADLLPLWSEGKYFPLTYSEAAIEREATDVLELVP
jgi:penicillin G amidase